MNVKDKKHKWRSCDQKAKYRNEAVAIEAASLYPPDSENRLNNAYRCRFCDGWHIGRKRQKQTIPNMRPSSKLCDGVSMYTDVSRQKIVFSMNRPVEFFMFEDRPFIGIGI